MAELDYASENRDPLDELDGDTLDDFVADPIDELDRDGGALEDADDEAMDRWADRYDELNGAPENDDDR